MGFFHVDTESSKSRDGTEPELHTRKASKALKALRWIVYLLVFEKPL